MKKLWFLLFIPLLCFSQNTRWTDYFSYFNIKTIQKVDNLIFCATENGLFSYNESTGEIKKFSKVNGLHDVKITAFGFNSINNALIVGYDNGKLDIVKQDKIHLVVDIPFEQNYQGDKRINHIYTEGNYAVLSMDFGITVFDLNRLEFKETCYFKQGLNYFKVNKSVILNNKIYAASSNGIYSHNIDGLLPNFAAWSVFNLGVNFNQIAKNNSTLIVDSNNTVSKSDDNGITWQNIGYYPDLKDIASTNNIILLVQKNNIVVLNSTFSTISSNSFSDNLNTGFYSNGILYAGTELNGLLKGSVYLAPDGPYNNYSYSLNILDNQLWVAPGGRDNNYNAPSYNEYGIYHFDGNKWKHLSNSQLNNNAFFMQVIPNPFKSNEVYALSYSNGLIKIVDGNFSIKYDHTNSVIPIYERITGGAFDKDGNLIFLQAFSLDVPKGANAINIKTPSNNMKHISLASYTTDDKSATMRPLVDNGHIWVPYPRGNKGLVIYKYNYTPLVTSDDTSYLISSTGDTGGLPSNIVLCVAMDLTGTAWIGTDSGLRILRNAYSSLESGNFNTERIVISQNGLGEEVLRDTKINVITVDAANRKWIGTYTSGVFYFSEDGTTLLNQFTADNSPLPSNMITDIQIDKTGEVFFVTPSGIVSYRGDVTDTGDEFGDVVAYPNPVRPGYTGLITIRGLAHDAYVKITDVAGNLVYETRAPGGVATWNGNNFNNKPVASGVYLVLMSNSDGKKHATTKIAIVR